MLCSRASSWSQLGKCHLFTFVIRPETVFSLLLTLSQFESTLRDMFRDLLKGKQAKWDMIRHEGLFSSPNVN